MLLLDEPYSALDPVLREELRAEVAALLRERGQAALHITHDPDEALSIADRVLVMGGGHILDDGSPERVYFAPASLESARALGRLNVLPAALLGETGQAASRWEDVTPCPPSQGYVTPYSAGAQLTGVLQRALTLRGSQLAYYQVGEHSVVAPQAGEVGERVPLRLERVHIFKD